MNEQMIVQLQAKVNQDKAILAFDEAQLALAINGWQTDKNLVAEAVAPKDAEIALKQSIIVEKDTIINSKDEEIILKNSEIERLTVENAVLKNPLPVEEPIL